VKVLQFVWEKPVLTFYRERFGKPEREAFVAVKARKLVVSRTEEDSKLKCTLQDFFPLMGELDYVSSKEGKADRYVLCWFDDTVDDFGKAFRRLTGVTFSEGIKCVTDEKGKISCNADFEAKHAKLFF
jgi:trehalose-6-phosphatase